jgi:hypothetical protein
LSSAALRPVLLLCRAVVVFDCGVIAAFRLSAGFAEGAQSCNGLLCLFYNYCSAWPRGLLHVATASSRGGVGRVPILLLSLGFWGTVRAQPYTLSLARGRWALKAIRALILWDGTAPQLPVCMGTPLLT